MSGAHGGWLWNLLTNNVWRRENKARSGIISRLCMLSVLIIFILFSILHFFFLQDDLYLSRLVRTSCAICFITESTINLFELLTFMCCTLSVRADFQHVTWATQGSCGNVGTLVGNWMVLLGVKEPSLAQLLGRRLWKDKVVQETSRASDRSDVWSTVCLLQRPYSPTWSLELEVAVRAEAHLSEDVSKTPDGLVVCCFHSQLL